MKTIRAALVVLVFSSLIAIDARPTTAEIYRPWCVQYQGSRDGGATNCGFTSYEQCMMTARGAGAGVCRIPGNGRTALEAGAEHSRDRQ